MENIVRYEVEDHVAIITMNLPDRRNPLSVDMCWALIEQIKQAEVDDDVHVVLLTGEGQSFCAGGDLKEFKKYQDKGASKVHKEGESTTELFKTLSNLKKPIIGAINGHALGGGFGLVASCHYSIASSEAKFGTTEIKLGLFPLVILPAVMDAVGPKKALELGFTGEIFSASKAVDLGLVNKVVPPNEVVDEAKQFAKQLAEASPLALRIGLDCYVKTRDMEWNKKLDYANTLRVISFLSDDVKEGADAFLEKRKPQWTGQ
ncbi:enoyl-CoA hydratase/isomerase family protein [Alkalihalobacterium alkalinitrilicum]|uniref:enoyl-CoA hydratase/isomerase family protein n=1 Tax=Alkalihalobacterium alkalinitrilicum TaxID=427920 RepID=UPI000995816C|nr:enoyl-CoA hydratase/isomerase family protein [Alkalihalobacterium alkalinitrilicum]